MIKTKVAFNESSKWFTSQVEVQSDDLSSDEVLKLAVELSGKAEKQAKLMTVRKFSNK